MLGDNISKFNSNFKNIIFFSEILDENELRKLLSNVKENLNQIYN